MTIAEKLVRAKADLDDVFSNGIDLGKQITYDDFWDSFQPKGNNIDSYLYRFAGTGWNNETFKPKYDINAKSLASTFYNTKITGDLVEILDRFGVTMKTEQCTNFSNTFNSSYYITRVGVLDTRNARGLPNTFIYTSGITTIDKIILKNDGTQTFTSTFAYTNNLQNIAFEGMIGNSINFASCPLTVASAVNVLQHLQGFSAGDAGWQKYTLTFSTTTKALLDQVQANDPNGYIPELMDDWRTYITMLGWNIG